MICLLEEGKAVDLVCLDFSKAFDTNSHSILLENLTAHGLDGCIVPWVKIWLDGCAKKVLDLMELNPLVAGHWSRSLGLSIGANHIEYLFNYLDGG